MHTKSKLISAVVAALAVSASSAFAAMATPESVIISTAYTQIARKGADDPLPPGCDDHGTDMCNASTIVAKKGADDPRPPECDDHGTDICNAITIVAKNGADDPIDGIDDGGDDFVAG